MVKKSYKIALLVLSHCAVAWLGYRVGFFSTQGDQVDVYLPSTTLDVLDGDTIVSNGKAFHVRGIDAPELGPWAECWAEAALAGHSKKQLESMLHFGSWRVVESHGSDSPIASADLVSDDGRSAADSMVVGGYAAETTGRWDWCNSSVVLRQARDGEPAPHGPNLWWPTGEVFDARAGDSSPLRNSNSEHNAQ